MHTITFTCETITPMFLSGADGTTPELRAPSIKGALRFWWRAMNGHLPTKVGNTYNYLPLKQKEQQIFGGAGLGEKPNKVEAQRSAFNVRISNTSEATYHTKSDLKGKGGGLEYIFYLITSENKQGEMMAPSDEAFKSPTTFDIIISGNDKDILLQASASFWLLTYFGGLGSRARRGGGNFAITYVEDEGKILEDKLKMMPTNDPTNFLKEGIKQVATIIQNNPQGAICSKYSTLKPSEIYFSKNSKDNWKGALNEIGLIMKNLRTDNEKDPELRKFTQKTLNQKAAFGLPISVRNEKNVVEFSNKDDFNHHSSPIIISIVKFGNKFYWTLVHLQGNFMPSNTTIVFMPTTKGLPKQQWNDVDNKLIKQFITDKVVPNSVKLTF